MAKRRGKRDLRVAPEPEGNPGDRVRLIKGVQNILAGFLPAGTEGIILYKKAMIVRWIYALQVEGVKFNVIVFPYDCEIVGR